MKLISRYPQKGQSRRGNNATGRKGKKRCRRCQKHHSEVLLPRIRVRLIYISANSTMNDRPARDVKSEDALMNVGKNVSAVKKKD